MKLELLFNIVTVLEIICVEFISVWSLSRRKLSFPKALGLYAAVTVPLILFMCLVAVNTEHYGDGSGRFMVLGVLYFLPVLVSYGGDWRSRVIIAFYSFSYGLAGFGASVRVGYLFEAAHLDLAVLLVETVLYAVTLPFFLRFSKRRVIPYIHKASRPQQNLLIRHTVVSFILIIVYNRTMVEDSSMAIRLLVYLLLLYFIILTYRLVVSYLEADDDKQELSELASTDRLTGLGNRLALRRQADMFIQEGGAFYLLFLDLDNFKSINDNYGHAMGDEYLQNFAKVLQRLAGPRTCFFRLAGDEFICLTRDRDLPARLRSLDFHWGDSSKPAPLGFSLGTACYPKDAPTVSALLELADKHMYGEKQRKSRRQ